MEVSTTVKAEDHHGLPRLLIFLFTDLVDSTGLKDRLGDLEYVRYVLQPHNRLFRQLLRDYPSAIERDNAGDGFFVTFESVTEAVQFALMFQHRMRNTRWELEIPLTRIGIHIGDAALFQDVSATQPKTAGQAQDLSARLMGLAGGGQILMTRAAFDGVRQYVRTHPAINETPAAEGGAAGLQLQWLVHGYYFLKGRAGPLEVCEVGAIGYAPLRAPADSEKAKRTTSELLDHSRIPINSSAPLSGTAALSSEDERAGETRLATLPDHRRTSRGCFRLVTWRRLWSTAGFLSLGIGAILVWVSTRQTNPLVEMRRKELERDVSLALSEPPLVLHQNPDDYQEVERLDPIDQTPFQLLADNRVIDLRMWKDVPSEKLHEQYSAMCLTRRIRLKKLKNVREYETEGRTTGLELCWRCLSQYPFRGVGQKGDVFVGQDRMKARRMVINVSSIPVGAEFELDLAATYWNSIQTEQEQWFGVIGYEGAFKVSLLLLFPQEKPFKQFRMMTSKTVRDQVGQYTGPKIVLQGDRQEWLYWEVPSPEDGHVYRIHWDW
jgi:class 3 adenylate cyclase